MSKSWVSILLLLACAVPSGAAVIRVPADYPTIGAGIAASAETDTVLVAPGTYSGSGNSFITIMDRSFTLVSEAGAASTIIDGQGSTQAFGFHRIPGTASITGFTFTNCVYTFGGAMYFGQSVYLRFFDCVFSHNRASTKGGAACNLARGRPSFTRCYFFDNEAGDTGGALFYHGSTSDDVVISECVFEANEARLGGAIYFDDGRRIWLSACEFVENTASAGGGALYMPDWSYLTAENCTFTRNSAGVYGGAVSDGVGWMTLTGCVFTENFAAAQGGAASFHGDCTVTHCTFVGNTTDGEGGAIFLSQDPNATISHCTFWGNGAQDGGGVYFWSGMDAFTMENCIIANSTSGGATGWYEYVAPELMCCDLFGNIGGDWTGGVAGQCDQNGNISADPLFCMDAGSENSWTLHDNSPCASPNSGGCGTIGAWGVDCGFSAIREASWGQIKALYR